ncbi:MAG: hypothetical protein ACTSU5_11115 [Promethearchaeota archaeon]
MILATPTPAGYESVGSHVGIYYEGLVLGIMLVLLAFLLRIYFKSRVPMTKNLWLGYLFYTIAIFFSWWAKWWLWKHAESALEGPYFLQLVYKFKFSMVAVILGNYYLANFFGTILSEKFVPPKPSRKKQVRKAVEVAFILVSHVPAYIARDSELALTTDALGFLVMILDLLFFIPAAVKAFKASRQMAFGKTYLSVGFMCAFMFNTAVMFLLDRVTMMMNIPGPFGELGYTFFYFAAWSSVIVALLFAIFGFVLKHQK